MLKRALLSLAAIALLFAGSATILASGPTRFNTLPPPASSPPTVDNPRLGTPNDPKFDSAEPDDPDSPPLTPTSDVWEEQYNLFGFANEPLLWSASRLAETLQRQLQHFQEIYSQWQVLRPELQRLYADPGPAATNPLFR